MNFEVDTDELKYCEVKLENSSTKVEDEIKVWEKDIEKLKTIWKGSAADVFYSKMDEYLKKLKMLSETTRVFGNAMKECYSNYETKDKEFSVDLQNERNKYDDEAFLNDPRNKEFVDMYEVNS